MALRVLHGAADHLGARALGELGQLVEMLLDDIAGHAREDQADEEDAARPRETVLFEAVQFVLSPLREVDSPKSDGKTPRGSR